LKIMYRGAFLKYIGYQDATMGGDMLHANRATLWRTPPLMAPFNRLLRSISPPMVAVFWQCLSFVRINSVV